MKRYFTLSLITKISIFLILVSACSTPEEIQSRKCTKALKHFEKVSFEQGCPWGGLDSTVSQKTTIMYRDSLIYVHIPGETVSDTIIIPIADSISTTVSILNTKYAISKAWIENSLLKHTLEQVKSDIGQTVKGLNKETLINKEKIIRIPYLVEKPVKIPLSWWQKFFLWSGVIAWGLLVTVIIIKIRLNTITKKQY
ncbi:MAG: hypothetical protein ACOYN4_15995 [Bacteroidales bacterium]